MKPTLRFLLRPVALAFALLIVAATCEAAFLGEVLVHQGRLQTVADAGGPLRMKTQRIAFLAELAVERSLTPGERAEMSSAIDSMRAGQQSLWNNPATRLGATPAESAELVGDIDAFATAAEDVLAHGPSASRSHAYLLANRVPLLKELDRAVDGLKAREAAEVHFLLYLAAALVLTMFVLIAGCWAGVVRPLERHLADSREKLNDLFEAMSDPVFTYDPSGAVAGTNAAAAAIYGDRVARGSGATHLSAIVRDDRPRAEAAFARALAGEYVAFETQIVVPGGGRRTIDLTLVPNVMDGRVTGVSAIARDVTEARRAAREAQEQVERIRDLYSVAASHVESEREQIGRALEVGRRRLGMSIGFIARVEAGEATVEACAGGGSLAAGDALPIDPAAFARWSEAGAVASFGRSAVGRWFGAVSDRMSALESYVLAPIRVRGMAYGAIGFASTERREALAIADGDFVRLVGALASAAIERAQTQRKLDALAFYDTLTGLPNRALMQVRFADAIAAARERGERFAVHFVDLDGFKDINDALGHAVGDVILQEVAHRLRAVIRGEDTVARFGGDEFVIVQHLDERSDAASLARRVLEAVSVPSMAGGSLRSVGASIGIAHFPEDGGDVETLLKCADEALYRAKAAGRGCYEFSELQTA